MVSNALLLEQKKIQAIVPKLEPYWQREIHELPDDLKKQLQDIKAIPPLTTGGLERVKSVLESLVLTDINIERLSQEDQIIAQKQTVENTPIVEKKLPTPIQILTNTLPKKITNLPVKTKDNLPMPSTKPTSFIQKFQPKPKTPADKIDFGKYYK